MPAVLCSSVVVVAATAAPRAPVSLFQPLDFGTRHGKLSEELVGLGTRDALR